jgi:ppGpp synthetase/RelA/SpoT-type nucleotidyltranferase
VDLVEEFIARYTKEYDFYYQVALRAHRMLEATLQEEGIRSIVTSRAKSISRLIDKCRKREQERDGGYQSVDEIFEDIADLAGVRVALYFPAEADQVGGMISRMFYPISPPTEFRGREHQRRDRRFSGYWANHYRVQLKEQDLGDSEKRYAAARIEIQVASVLMHAWSEVEHDLEYKPLKGTLSQEEYSILDLINGLVIAGEIGLERLQKAGEARVAVNDRIITSHYDLAVHLLNRAARITDKPISESGLGRVDLLFDFITRLELNTPERLEPYLDALDGNVERRPLAEQIIDSLLAEDQSRYDIYRSIRDDRRSGPYGTAAESGGVNNLGEFLERWITLEGLLRALNPLPRTTPIWQQIRSLDVLSKETRAELDRLRRARNSLVHGIEIPSPAELAEDIQRLEAIIAEIRQLRQNNDQTG